MNRLENLDFCIRYLMRQEKVQAEVPRTLEGKQRLLRVLMNVWHPQPLGAEFLQAQDAELHAQLMDKGVVTHPGRLWQGDITRLKVDAIVNAANAQGLGCWQPLHSCIDNAIHSAAGLQLRQECDKVLGGSEIATGGAIITPGYNLPARYVIHTVGPIVATDSPTAGQQQQLAGCYHSCLSLAHDFECRSIAFCCISTGVFHFPNRLAAEIAVKACRDARMKVVFCVFKDEDYAIYRQLLGLREEKPAAKSSHHGKRTKAPIGRS